MKDKPLSRSQEALRHSKPLILTAFVNRVGTIGLSLLPILLVQRKIDFATSAWILGGVKSVGIYGTLLGGVISDRVGARKTLLLGFLALGLGLSGLPFQAKAALILGFAVIAQFGDALVRVSTRMVLTRTVPRDLQKESFAWLRSVNNFGQIFSYGLGTLGAKLGVLPLMLFDGATGFLAFLVGLRLIPPLTAPVRTEAVKRKLKAALVDLLPAIGCSFLIATWNFYYELFMSGMAARLEVLHPGEGLRSFSAIMVFNTLVCALFAIKMAGLVSRPSRVFSTALVLSVAGLALGILFPEHVLSVGAAIFAITAGELLFGALGQLLQVRLLPEGKAEGFFYSAMVVVAQVGRLLGAALAFPWVVRAEPGIWRVPAAFWAPLVLSFLLLSVFATRFDRAAA